jgi:hypothetical protein
METKQVRIGDLVDAGSHSLGTLIEWKLPGEYVSSFWGPRPSCSHSLGTLIEWKLKVFGVCEPVELTIRSHSLGTLIEWKLAPLQLFFLVV